MLAGNNFTLNDLMRRIISLSDVETKDKGNLNWGSWLSISDYILTKQRKNKYITALE